VTKEKLGALSEEPLADEFASLQSESYPLILER
jgi:hypothetical protein